MRQSRQKPDPFRNDYPSGNLISNIWESGHDNDPKLTPPDQNSSALVPYSRLVHNLNNLESIWECIPIDLGTVELIQKKTGVFPDDNLTRKCITLHLIGRDTTFSVDIWIIPIFLDGVLIHHLYAADAENQQLLLKHRNPVKSSTYDILP